MSTTQATLEQAKILWINHAHHCALCRNELNSPLPPRPRCFYGHELYDLWIAAERAADREAWERWTAKFRPPAVQ